MTIKIPELSLVVLIGTSSSGKSSLAKRLFKSTEILSSDVCRGMASNDENSLDATADAFEILYFILAKRLCLREVGECDHDRSVVVRFKNYRIANHCSTSSGWIP